MLVKKSNYDLLRRRIIEIEDKMLKQDEWIKQLLEACDSIKQSVKELVDSAIVDPSGYKKVYTDRDGMYSYQKYKEYAKNRKNGGVDDGDL